MRYGDESEDREALLPELFRAVSIVNGLLAEVVQEEEFEIDEAIIEQGSIDNSMFIVKSGSAVACIQGEEGEVEVMNYAPGDYFGEVALLTGVARKASVYSTSEKTVCLMVDKPAFTRILGPVGDIMKRNIDKYSKYSDFMNDDGEDAGKTAGSKSKTKITRRKRNSVAADTPSHAAKKEGMDTAAEPATLKEKVAEDFKRPSLVEPTPEFSLEKESTFSIIAGLRNGQKFPNDKPLIVTHSEKGVSKKIDEVQEEGRQPLTTY